MGVIRRKVFQHISGEENHEELLEAAGLIEVPEPAVRPAETREQVFLPAILPQGRSLRPQQAAPESRGRRGSNAHSKTQEERYPKGHKKRRRYENNRYLLSLAAENENGLEDVAESRSVFSQLLQEKEKMTAWNQFLSFSEENQALILLENKLWLDDEDDFDDSWVIVDGNEPHAPVSRKDLRALHPSFTPAQAFESMCPRLKAIFKKRHFPMATLYQLETEVSEFFRSSPKGTFVLELECSYDRLILHAICHYNYLRSQSFTGVDDRRETRVRNIYATFSPPEIPLFEFVRQQRS